MDASTCIMRRVAVVCLIAAVMGGAVRDVCGELRVAPATPPLCFSHEALVGALIVFPLRPLSALPSIRIKNQRKRLEYCLQAWREGPQSCEEQRTAYQRAWEQSLALTVPPPIFQNKQSSLTITFISGQPERFPVKNDFSAPLVERLSDTRMELLSLFPFLAPTMMPVGQMHVTLVVPFLLMPSSFLDDSDAADRRLVYERVTRTWMERGPLTLLMKGLLLTPKGDIVVPGYIQDATLPLLRQKWLADVKDINPDVKLAGSFSHITLARSSAPGMSEFGSLRQWIWENRDRFFGLLHVRYPRWMASSDLTGCVHHEAAESELEEWNNRLLLRQS